MTALTSKEGGVKEGFGEIKLKYMAKTTASAQKILEQIMRLVHFLTSIRSTPRIKNKGKGPVRMSPNRPHDVEFGGTD